MDIDIIFKIAAIGITVAVIYHLLVRAGREDQAMLISIMGLVVVMMMVITQIKVLFDTVKTLFDL
jgi:stage III sporulation protein AC